MTEAVRPTEETNFHPTRVVSGDVLTSPISLAHAIDVTDTAPRASLGNLSADMRQGTGLKEKAAAVILAFGMLGGGKVLLDNQRVSAQSPSPTSSFTPSESASPDPLTGQVDPTCPPGMVPTKPEVSPSPTPLPEPSLPGNIGMLPNEGVLFSSLNAEGRTVNVSSQAQEAAVESATPSSQPIGTIDVNGDGVVDERDDTNGDGIIDEADTETALLVDCGPDGSPLPPASAEPSAEPIQDAPDSIQIILKGRLGKITEKSWNRILSKSAPAIANYFKGLHLKSYDTAEEVIEAYQSGISQLLKNPNADILGKEFAGTITGVVQKAQEAGKAGDIEAMKSFMSLALADARLAMSLLRHSDSHGTLQDRITREQLNKWISAWIDERELN